jgi:hypothetical protein
MNIKSVDWESLPTVLQYCDYLNITYGKHKINSYNPTVVVKYRNRRYYQIMHYKRALVLEQKKELEIIKQSIPKN